MCQVYEETAASLAAEIASSASSPLAAAITSILSTCLGLAAEQLQRRVDELFVHSVESASLDTQLVESINTIRFARKLPLPRWSSCCAYLLFVVL